MCRVTTSRHAHTHANYFPFSAAASLPGKDLLTRISCSCWHTSFSVSGGGNEGLSAGAHSAPTQHRDLLPLPHTAPLLPPSCPPPSPSGTILSKLVPFLYGKQPMLFQLGSAPYAKILAAVQRDGAAAAALLLALASIALTKAFGLW